MLAGIELAAMIRKVLFRGEICPFQQLRKLRPDLGIAKTSYRRRKFLRQNPDWPQAHAFSPRFGCSYTWNDFDTDRNVSIGSFPDKLSANYIALYNRVKNDRSTHRHPIRR
jgi:hypothetical protein